jgi:hypothetical protein
VNAGDFFLDGVAEEIVAVGRQRVHFDEKRIGQLDGNGFRHAGKIAIWGCLAIFRFAFSVPHFSQKLGTHFLDHIFKHGWTRILDVEAFAGDGCMNGRAAKYADGTAALPGRND